VCEGEKEAYVKCYGELDFFGRFLGLVTLGMVPLLVLLVLAETLVLTQALMEGAAVYFLSAVVVSSFLAALLVNKPAVSLVPVTVASLISAVAACALYVTYPDAAVMTATTALLLGLYVLRFHYACSSTSTTVSGYFHSQLKTDTAVILLAVALYAFEMVFHRHLPLIEVQVGGFIVIDIVYWSTFLRQLERLELGLRDSNPSRLASWLVFLVFCAFAGSSMFSAARDFSVKVIAYAPPPWVPYQVQRSKMEEIIDKKVHRPKFKIHALLTTAVGNHIAVTALICLAIALVVSVYFLRRRREFGRDTERPSSPIQIQQRGRLSRMSELRLLPTDNPVRRQVQAHLRKLHQKGVELEKWRTIRGIALMRLHSAAGVKGANGLPGILEDYDRERYGKHDD